MSTRTEALSRRKKGNSSCISVVCVSAESLKITRIVVVLEPGPVGMDSLTHYHES